jgi:16S rRNA (cytidine1402-2'-O)-methyltransferase
VTDGGRLVLVGTPIGNLGDLSRRAARVLGEADLVCCEDTRRTGRLLDLSDVRPRRLMAVNDHTEARAVREVLRRLELDETVAVVTDAGMPGISDPGERLVRAAAAADHTVEVVPGPTAALSALVVSGLPTGRFVFEGFLPRRGSGRTERLAALADERRTIVLYEAPHRLARTLADLRDALGGDRPVAVARELTKLHEEVWRGNLAEAAAHAEDRPPIGEHVLVVGGAPAPVDAADDEVEAALREELGRGLRTRDAAARVAADLGVPKRRAYDLATRLES